jgi:hypothetical protein
MSMDISDIALLTLSSIVVSVSLSVIVMVNCCRTRRQVQTEPQEWRATVNVVK